MRRRSGSGRVVRARYRDSDSVFRKSCHRELNRMIYLDNAATSFPKPEAVYQALDAFARHDLATPGRAGHKMSLAAEHALDNCRHLLNQFLHGEGPERFIFTLNCTDALNMAFKGVLKQGDHV